MIKIWIADDQQLIRESLKIILDTSKEFEVTGLMANGQEVLSHFEEDIPDVILMDVRMPEMDGVTCTKIVKERYPQVSIIILTTFDDDEYIFDAIKNGASGYLLKGCSFAELSQAIQSVLDGGAIFNPQVAKKIAGLFSEMAKHTIIPKDEKGNVEFSETEWKIIEQIADGYSNKEIAKALRFSEGTIRNYLSVILDKLELRDRTQLAIWYLKKGKRS